MKNIYRSLCLFITLLGSLTGCKKAQELPRQPVSATYLVLNEQGQETAVFAPGQAIVLRYEVRNDTDQEVYFNNPVFDYAHFMDVSRDDNGQLSLVGRPYTDLSLTYDMYVIVAAHSTRSFTIPWVASAKYPDVYPFNSHAPNAQLPVGRYQTAVQPQLTWHHGTEADITVAFAAQDFVRTFEVR
jgi:hypothetical protein